MPAKKPLFDTPLDLKDFNIEQLFQGIASKFDIKSIRDSHPFIVLVNHPRTKNMKANSGVDLSKGDLGDQVEMDTECEWGMVYTVPKDNQPAKVEVSYPMFLESAQQSLSITVEQQTLLTAIEITDFLVGQGWKGFKVEEGSEGLVFCIWVCLSMKGLKLTGFKPTDFDEIRKKNTEPIVESLSSHYVNDLESTLGYFDAPILTALSTGVKVENNTIAEVGGAVGQQDVTDDESEKLSDEREE